MARRFPPPWTAEEISGGYVVRDANRQALEHEGVSTAVLSALVKSMLSGVKFHYGRKIRSAGLVADAILDCSKRGAIVLDCFGGSGTTLIAAEKTGRRSRLIELDPVYVDVTIRRFEKLTGKEAIHAESGLTFMEIQKRRGNES